MNPWIVTPLADDVAAASAACLFNTLAEILKLSAPDAYARLQAHIHTAILAYADSRNNWGFPPEASDN